MAEQLPYFGGFEPDAVCCGGDGYVYMTGQNGRIFRGRADRWEYLTDAKEDGSALRFEDIVWYGDRLWCTSKDKNGLWTCGDGTVRRADVPDWAAACSGSLAAGDGVLLAAGYRGAAYLEGGVWHKILLFDEMDAALEA